VNQKDCTFIVWSCDCGCGVVKKIDISKYKKSVQRGLQRDYGIRAAPPPQDHGERHQCPVCHQWCKSASGTGTVAALEIERFSEVHQYIMKALAAQGPATVDEIRLYIDVNFDYKTPARAVATRISELRAWRLVEAIELDKVGKPTGTRYESGPVVAYKLDRTRAEIVEFDDWLTWRLKAMDAGASFTLEAFTAG